MTVCDKLLDYNLVDVEGLVLLDDFFKMIEDQFEQAHLVVAPPDDGIYSSKMHDHDMIRDYRETMVFDTKYQKWERKPITGKKQIGSKFTITLEDLVEVRKRRGDTEEIKSLHDLPKIGGYVPEPLRAGMFVWVITIDFNKQYPNAIMSSNAGIKTAINLLKYNDEEVWDKDGTVYQRTNLIETPMGFFRKDIESVNRKKFMKWLELRLKAQEMATAYLKAKKTIEDPMYKLLDGKQFRIKTFTNGGFGIMGLPADRNYSKFIFNNCTLMCQDLTKKMMNVLKELDYVVIGGDTDSCFVCLKCKNLEEAIEEGKELVNKINKIIDNYLRRVYNIQEHTMKVGLETISDKFWVKAAKNYVKRNLWKDGQILDKAELEIKGISQKKRNTSKFSADLQSTMIDILLDSPNVEEDFKLLMKVLDSRFETLPWTYIAPKGAINSEIDDYDLGNRNARGARNTRDYFNKYFNPGDNPYIMPFSQFPKKLNGKFVTPYKGDTIVLSFDEEDVEELKNLGFVPDYEELKRSQLNEKSKPFLSLMNTSYYQMRALNKVSNDMEL